MIAKKRLQWNFFSKEKEGIVSHVTRPTSGHTCHVYEGQRQNRKTWIEEEYCAQFQTSNYFEMIKVDAEKLIRKISDN